ARASGVGDRTDDLAVAEDAAALGVGHRQVPAQDGVDDVGVLHAGGGDTVADAGTDDVEAAGLGADGAHGRVDHIDEPVVEALRRGRGDARSVGALQVGAV